MIKMSVFNNIKKDYIILAFVTVLIFYLHTIHISQFSIFSILDDEYGYWGNAAYLSGLNWSDTVSQIPYYSFGYSLLLVPLFWIFDNTIQMYRAAIFMNSMMVCVSFLLCYNISKKITDNVNKYILISISFLISMYPTYIVYTYVAWSECLLMVIYWFLTWSFLGLNDKSKAYNFYLIGFLSGYIYFVHQRTLGILISSIMVVLIMKVHNKINFRQFINFIMSVILVLIIGYYIKNDLQSNLWLNGLGLSINDYSGQFSKLNQLFKLGGLLKVFKILIGQLFYLGASSYLVYYFGFYELIQKLFKYIYRINKVNIMSNDENSYEWMYMFLIISVTITMIISAIFFINPIRINEIVFGRYNEIILEPILLIGFVKIIKEKASKDNYFILLSFSVFAIITNFTINSSGLINYQTIDIIGLFLVQPPYGIFITAIITIMLFRIIYISFSGTNSKLIIITIFVICSIFFAIGGAKSKALVTQNKEMMKILTVTDIITFSEEDLPIYFLFNDTDKPSSVKWNKRLIRDRSVSDYYQFILKDKKIIPVNAEKLVNIKNDKFVLTTNNVNISHLLVDYHIRGKDDGSILLRSK